MVIVLLHSCDKKVSMTCTPLPPDGALKVQLNGAVYQMPYWETIMDADSSFRYFTTDGSGTHAQLSGLITWLGLPEAHTPKCLVIYSDTVYRQGEDLTIVRVLGCQHYYVDAGNLMHSFYLMRQGKLSEVPALRCQAKNISFNARQDLYELYFMKDHKTVVAWDITDKDAPYNEGGKNEVSEGIKKLWELQEGDN